MGKRKYILAFIVAILVQLVLLGIVISPKITPRLYGKQITLKVQPFDPYDLFSGYYLNLSYPISRREGFQNCVLDDPEGRGYQKVYALLQPGENGVWTGTTLTDKFPAALPPGAVVLKGGMNYWRILYDIERFYVPEGSRSRIEQDLRDHIDDAYADVLVDRNGNALLLRLRVEDRVYEY